MHSFQSFWNSPDIISCISTFLNWSIAVLGVLVLLFNGRYAHLQKQETIKQSKKITQLEQTTRVKPINEKLFEFLSKLDPQIIPAIKTGSTNFQGTFPQRKVHELEKLCGEEGADKFITLTVNPRNNINIDGKDNPVEIVFVINPDILN